MVIAKSKTKDAFIDHERTIGDRRWPDTVVVFTIKWTNCSMVTAKAGSYWPRTNVRDRSWLDTVVVLTRN